MMVRMIAGVSAALLAGAASGSSEAETSLRISPSALHATQRASLMAAASSQSTLAPVMEGPEGYKLQILGQLQFRYTAEYQDDVGDDDSEFTHGFTTERVRLGFKGTVIDPSIEYFIWAGFGANGDTLLLDAWVSKKIELGGGSLILKAGQFKLPIWHEWAVSETRLQFVERSVLDGRFRGLYGQGVSASWNNDRIGVYGAFSDGLRSWTESGDASSRGDQWALTGRMDVRLYGEWAQRLELVSFNDSKPSGFLGAAVHYQDGGTLGGQGTTDIYDNGTEILQVSGDVQLGFGGANLFAAVIYNQEDRPRIGGVSGEEYEQWGFLIQGGYFITETIELAARYEYGDLDGQGSVSDELNLLTLGVNKYWAKHTLKWQTDIGFAFNEVDGAWGGSGRGFQGDVNGADYHLVLRSQLQVLF